MNFNRLNNIVGWMVGLFACAVYILTMEAGGSLWDCGEFASSAFKLQLPHPPGAPFFVLLGRVFMIPFTDHPITGLNLMSALASGFTILFLFWTITHFGRKLFERNDKEITQENTILVMFAGAVGALAYTFSDSFWFSAVESEVYALSSFFTAIVFWAMLKWEQSVTNEKAAGITGHFTSADRWIILIFYLMGLSIGVHLLNLLTIPALVLIYYFKRYDVTPVGTFLAFIIGCVITGLVQIVVIQWSIKGAGNMDILFVNDFGLPFFSGFATFFLLIALLVFYLHRVAMSKGWNFLKLGLWCFSFMLMGYSTYFTTMIRSNADTPIDMFNVDNPVSLVGYVSRQQYGDWPILYGQDFTASPVDVQYTPVEVKSNGRYEEKGKKVEYVYAPEEKHIFPRMWDASNDQGHADYYANWTGINKDDKGNWERSPTVAENIGFFFDYQLGWMYTRYFLWNFMGKQNDIQGIQRGNVRDGNSMLLDNQTSLIDSLKNNKARNTLFALPLLLGLLGLLYQLKQDRKDFIVTGLLFFFTGIAIVIYLNPPGNQPRERDYAYVGSFYAFAIWIGLGVFFVKEIFSNMLKGQGMTATLTAGLLCMAMVPANMAKQEWDDHDRSKKMLARDLATNYLNSCAPNAILISFGDNDTYPLWYAQEVEGIRKDVRVINSSLLGTDWYINQLRYKVNESDPIDVIWSADQIEGSNRDVLYYSQRPEIDPSKYMDLYTMMKDFGGSDDQSKMEPARDGSFLNIFPSKKVSVPVDAELVRRNGTVNPDDSIVPALQFEMSKNILFKNDAAVLNIIAANKWKRPIYFTSPYGELGFQNYLRQDGLTYRLVPVAGNDGNQVNQNWAYEKLMKFSFGNADKPGVYFDEENRRHVNSIRLSFAQAATSIANTARMKRDGGQEKEASELFTKARQLLNRCDKGILSENIPIGMPSRGQQHNQIALQFMYAAYVAEDSALAEKYYLALKKDMQQQAAYYGSLSDNSQEFMRSDNERNNTWLQNLEQIKMQFSTKPIANKPDSSRRP